ncbi:MAG: hypothetical protein ISR21_05070 [Candidatus Poseidoniaceae archaeon]|nr:hypothetical protein [Candidatus Poseidoniaceae archaeon]
MEPETHAAQNQEKGEYPFIEKVFISIFLVPLLVFSIVFPLTSIADVIQTGRREMVLGILGTICIGPFYAIIPYLFFTTQRGLLRKYVIQIDKDRDTLELQSTFFGKIDQTFEHKLSEVKKVKMSNVQDTDGEGSSSRIWIQGSTLWGEDWELEITVFYNNSKERGWKNKFQDTAQRFAAVLGVEEDSEKIRT